MSQFVSKDRVAVSVDTPEGTDTVWIKAKMGYGSRQRVLGSVARLAGVGPGKTPDDVDLQADMSAYNIVLLVENILDWGGPGFLDEHGALVPPSRAAIEQLDPESELVTKVLAEINKRNLSGSQNGASPSPNSVGAGSTGSSGGSKRERA